MTREEVIELMAKIITDNMTVWGDSPEAIAEAILNLCYPCRECEGTGKVATGPGEYAGDIKTETCPECHGTGKSGKVLAILSEDQTLPINIYSDSQDLQIYREAQQVMVQCGWRKVKVKSVQEKK